MVDIEQALQQARQDLLELTARNRLIHTPLAGKRKSWLQVVDESSERLFDLLVRQGKTLSFLPRQEPPQTESSQESADDQVDDERRQFIEAFDQNESSDGDSDQAKAANEAAASSPENSEDAAKEIPASHIDRFLQTDLTEEPLQKKLLNCYYDARTAEEEQGVSILYLACGFLKWREEKEGSHERFAPLLLIPVELTRNTARSRFQLRFRDEDLVTNLSIQARLKEDFGITLPDLPESVEHDDDWSPTTYFDQVREITMHRDGWQVLDDEILLWMFSFTKFLMYRDLSPEAWPDKNLLANHAMLQGLLGNGFETDSMLPPLCGDDEPIDQFLNPADVIHIADADSSQAVVIEEIARGRNLVVQGPPGTGKSQTITNAIAAAVHAGKRVLFIAEKMAALDVVRRRLEHAGVGDMVLELHSHKARKRNVLDNLKATLYLTEINDQRNVPIEELRSTAIRLREHDQALHQPVEGSGTSPYQAIGRTLQLRSNGGKTVPYRIDAAANWTPQEYEQRLAFAKDLDQLLEASGSPCDNAWYGVTCDPLSPAHQERLLRKLPSIQTGLQKLLDDANELSGKLQLPTAGSLDEISRVALLAEHIKQCPAKLDPTTIENPQWATELDRLESIVKRTQTLVDQEASLLKQVSETAFDFNWSTTRLAIAAHGTKWWRLLISTHRNAINQLKGVCLGQPPADRDARLALIDQIIGFQKATEQFADESKFAKRLLGSAWHGKQTDFKSAQAIVQWCRHSLDCPLQSQHARPLIARAIDLQAIEQPLQHVAKSLQTVRSQLEQLAGELKLVPTVALQADHVATAKLQDWQQRMQAWQAVPEQLSHYLASASRVSKLRTMDLSPLADEVETGVLPPSRVEPQLRAIRSEAVIEQAWATRDDLAQFHGETFEQLRTRFANLDQQRIERSRLDVARTHYRQIPSSLADSGQVSVVRREINKKRRHMPLRVLLREAGQAIQKIKPVFMMSPLSVAQYLKPGSVEFDLLVIDEASQVQPVDALGAIARSKQIVVVGDQKQLPPTDFFSRMSGDTMDDDGDEAVYHAGDLESILGLCEAQGLPSRMLRWHYRSKHESLIAVSNRKFYDDRLFIIPSPIRGGGPLGLSFRYIENGCYDRGGSRANRQEAIAVANAVMEHAANHPNLSLGVATFSSAQRDAILDELEQLRRNNHEHEAFFATGGASPFFVKSLENVQGDERDVIYISIGYGHDKDGYFAHNFGPLNREGGERRLNVLISRASSACEVFSSIRSDDINLARAKGEGVAALKMYLHYAEHGHLEATQSHGSADSLFEEQVAKKLRERGLHVDHQIGEGGFFIDLAIRDPDQPGRYLLGIECDGAQYHSSRWVRDRDRIRQQILESRGWVIHRVWSTDWFQRPDEQLNSVLEALEKARQHWANVDQDAAEAAALFKPRSITPVANQGTRWDRREAQPELEKPVQGDTPYQLAEMEANGYVGGPTEMNSEQFENLVVEIVTMESPIHVDEVGRRCISLLGRGRLTSALKRKIDEAAQKLASNQAIDYRGDFLYQPEQQAFPVRNRRHVESSSLRKVEHIAPEELRQAILTVVKDHIGPDQTELFSSVAKDFGMSNSKPFQAVIRQLIEQLTAENKIQDRSGKLFVG